MDFESWGLRKSSFVENLKVLDWFEFGDSSCFMSYQSCRYLRRRSGYVLNLCLRMSVTRVTMSFSWFPEPLALKNHL